MPTIGAALGVAGYIQPAIDQTNEGTVPVLETEEAGLALLRALHHLDHIVGSLPVLVRPFEMWIVVGVLRRKEIRRWNFAVFRHFRWNPGRAAPWHVPCAG